VQLNAREMSKSLAERNGPQMAETELVAVPGRSPARASLSWQARLAAARSGAIAAVSRTSHFGVISDRGYRASVRYRAPPERPVDAQDQEHLFDGRELSRRRRTLDSGAVAV
jgi:hypothetical protein